MISSSSVTQSESWSACREAIRASTDASALDFIELQQSEEPQRKDTGTEVSEGDDIQADVQDIDIQEDNVACVLFQKGIERKARPVYISNGLLSLSGSKLSHLQDQGSSMLLPEKEWLNTLLNGDELQRIGQFHETVLRDNLSSAPLVALVIVVGASGSPFWTLVHVLEVQIAGLRHVLHHFVGLPQPVSQLLWPSADANSLDIDHGLVPSILGPLRKVAQNWKGANCFSKDLLKRVQTVVFQLDEILSEGLEGEIVGTHFAPRLGLSAAKLFESSNRLEKMKTAIRRDLGPSWGYYTHQDGTRNEVAWLLSDLRQPDHPVVHMSKPAQNLTGFSYDWARGRNSRFLQVRSASRNKAYNGPESQRIGRFVEDDSTQANEELSSIVLQETYGQEPIWNLVFLRHIRIPGGPHYLLTILTPLIGHEALVSELLPVDPTTESLAVVAHLREILQEHLVSFSPSEQSFMRLSEKVVSNWIFDVGKRVSGSWAGGIYCPIIGLPAVREFETFWPEVEASALRPLLRECEVEVSGKVVACVSSAESLDFPLVHLSEGFEELTGYDRAFALGRNCRFLGVKDAAMNKALNGLEMENIKNFCTKESQGHTELFFLINESSREDRFWNVLLMKHIEVHGHAYILAVQTILDLPLPRIIERPISHIADAHGAAAFAESLGNFLDDMRPKLREQLCHTSVVKHTKIVEQRILEYLRKSCDDYEGEHYVPRVGDELASSFRQDLPPWMAAMQEIQEQKLAWLVIDLDSPTLTVVAASPSLWEVAGYGPDYAVGRNYRFLLPKLQQRCKAVNDPELSKLEEQSADSTPSPTVLLFESPDRKPYWAVVIWERYPSREGNGRGYAAMKFMRLESIIERSNHSLFWTLGDLLVLDQDAVAQLNRLRKLLLKTPTSMLQQLESAKAPLRRCLDGWACRVPASMSWPAQSVPGVEAPVPSFGLEIRTQYALLPLFPQALESGIRHFSFVFSSSFDGGVKDPHVFALEGQLFSLKVAHAFSDMNKSYYNYMCHRLVISLRTAPQTMACFQETRKALHGNGQSIAMWILDVSGLPPISTIQECWKTMSDVQEQGYVAALGLYGGGEKQLEAVLSTNRAPVSLYASDLQGRDVESIWAKAAKSAQKTNLPMPVFSMHIAGPRNELLSNPRTEEFAESLNIPPALLAARWANSKGMLLLANPQTVPGLSCEAESATSTAVMTPAMGGDCLSGPWEPMKPVALPSADRSLCGNFHSDAVRGHDLNEMFGPDALLAKRTPSGIEQGSRCSSAVSKFRSGVGAVTAANRLLRICKPRTTASTTIDDEPAMGAAQSMGAMSSRKSARSTRSTRDISSFDSEEALGMMSARSTGRLVVTRRKSASSARSTKQFFNSDSDEDDGPPVTRRFSDGMTRPRKSKTEHLEEARRSGRDRDHLLKPIEDLRGNRGTGGSTTPGSGLNMFPSAEEESKPCALIPRPPSKEAGLQGGSPLLRRLRSRKPTTEMLEQEEEVVKQEDMEIIPLTKKLAALVQSQQA